MRKWLLTLLLTTPVYAQVFTEDIAKINHFIAEEEIENFLRTPGATNVTGSYLMSLRNPLTDEAVELCAKNPADYKPLNIRYELVAVVEKEPNPPELKRERITTVFVARISEPAEEIIGKVKGILEEQATSAQNGTPGKFRISKSEDLSKSVVLYTGPETNIDVNSSVSAAGTYNLDLNTFRTTPISSNVDVQMDVTNRMSLSQKIDSGTDLKGSVTSTHSTGQRSLASLDGTKFELSSISAQARIDSQLNRQTKAYTEINYNNTPFGREVQAIAGFNVTVPANAELIVFTGRFSTTRNQELRRPANAAELGFEYKNKKGVTIYSRIRGGTDRTDRRVETGLKIDLNR